MDATAHLSGTGIWTTRHLRAPIPHAAQAELALRYQAGDERAIDELISVSMRAVVYQAKKTFPTQDLTAADWDDVLAVGAAGIWEAAKKYDPASGVTFIGYARWWIRAALVRSYHRSRAGFTSVESRRLSVLSRLETRLGRQATAEELHAEMTEGGRGMRGALETAADLVRLSRHREVSMDATVGDQESARMTVASVVGEDAREVQAEEDDERHRRYVLESALSQLRPRWALVLRRYYGLDTPDRLPRSLDEVGQELGITRERVRQIRDKALAKVRTLLDPKEITA